MTTITRRAAAGTLLALLLTACNAGSTGDNAAINPGATPSGPAATAPAPAATTTTPTPTMTLAVYYLVETRNGPMLQREFRAVPRNVAKVRAAVDAMLHLKPRDRDYTSVWPKATTIRGISMKDDVATVDLSAEAGTASAGSAVEGVSFQQLIYTVTAAAPAVEKVRLLIDGKERETLWGHVDIRGAHARGNHTTYWAPVSVEKPLEGTTVRRTLTFGGTSNTFEANVVWEIRTGCAPGTTCVEKPKTYKKSHTTATAGTGTRGSWSVTVKLPAEVFETSGWIEIRAMEYSAKDGSEIYNDTKVVRAVA